MILHMSALPLGYLCIVEIHDPPDYLARIEISPALVIAIEDDDEILVIDSDLDRQRSTERRTVTLRPSPAAARRYLRRLLRLADEEGDRRTAQIYEGAILYLDDLEDDFDR